MPTNKEDGSPPSGHTYALRSSTGKSRDDVRGKSESRSTSAPLGCWIGWRGLVAGAFGGTMGGIDCSHRCDALGRWSRVADRERA